MKKIITLLILTLVSICSYSQFTQKVRLTKDGYETVDSSTTSYITTHQSVTNKKTGEVSEVFQTKNGKLFYFRISKKTGKEYRQYLKLES